MEYKFKVGERVTVTAYDTYRKGKVGVIDLVDHDDPDYTCRVRFSDDPYNFDWYQEDEIESATRVIYDDVKVIVDQSKPVTTPVKIKPEGRKYDSGKPMYNLLPADALEEVVKVLTYGSVKYNEPAHEENWRKVEYPEQRYFAAMQRHVWAIRKGEMNDPESGISHYAHAITSLMFLLQAQIEANKNANPT